MAMSQQSLQNHLIQAYCQWRGAKDCQGLEPSENAFLQQIADDYEAEEIPELSNSEMAQILSVFWSLGQVRDLSGKPIINIGPCGIDHHRLDQLIIIQNDAPFIVDSVMGALLSQNVRVRSMFHPIVTNGRDAKGNRHPQPKEGHALKESYILVIFERETKERYSEIMAELAITLSDLHSAVNDFSDMRRLLEAETSKLQALMKSNVSASWASTIEENIAFLEWIKADHFVLLGSKIYDYPRSADGSYVSGASLSAMGDGFGVLRDTNRPVLRNSNEPAVLSKAILDQIAISEPVTVAKANLKSKVHRRVHMDYIGIKRYDGAGQAIGESRFVGLFTAEAYDRSVFDVPLVRKKAHSVIEDGTRLGASQGGYNEKRLKNILETYPRDELFQINEADLIAIAKGILRISDRPRVRIFARQDTYDRFISVLLFVPQEFYQETLRQKAGEWLAKSYGGRFSSSYPNLSGALLSSIHYIIGVTPGAHLSPNLHQMEQEIQAMAQSWSVKLLERYTSKMDEADQSPIHDVGNWAKSFPIPYQDRYDVNEALIDARALGALNEDEPLSVRAYKSEGDPPRSFRFKLYHRALSAIALSDILPVLDHCGFKTIEEYGFGVIHPQKGQHFIHEFILKKPDQILDGLEIDFDTLKEAFSGVMMAIRHRVTEDDGFNQLVQVGLHWREITLLRALVRYRMQSGLDGVLDTQIQALRDNPMVTRALVNLFMVKFAPSSEDYSKRLIHVKSLLVEIEKKLQSVVSLEHDKVLRRLMALIDQIQRTNFFQTAPDSSQKAHISFKIASQALKDLPEPKPYREIFVWAPNVEGVHLRFGPVARGGLRWSDRRDDFRTEVLGLVKAQQVKNAVIVPVGSKGGFFPKQLPKKGTPDEVRAVAIHAYKTFLSGLLDLTDNIDSNNKVISPPSVVCWDGPDPYLVVAADKGTATFSDIANGLAATYGFWLGDAFASGGSKGYDHKVMGITAMGAWEAVKRHFREKGKNIQEETFSVAGVGDMSGDVFGNGMLLSTKIKLVAAFDHRDIFLDPNPDIASSYAERQRLFALPRSSWADYRSDLISKGGGVFSRSLKSIPVSAEMAGILGISAGEMAPNDLLKAILSSPVELLYFGGIGTYIKAPHQSQADVGDKANDAIRVDAGQVRAEVIGEGANLGITQVGRIALSAQGVRLNTDAIDNSAGVDCSDHEVNIKILLGALIARGQLKSQDRDQLLVTMTKDVSELVLKDNYNQTLALSLAEEKALEDVGSLQAFMGALESRGRLDRKVEDLPTNAVMDQRRATGKGLLRPELAVLMSYAKLVLFDDIMASKSVNDPGLSPHLIHYFPQALHKYDDAIKSHRLSREIIATVLSNDIVNMAGPTFMKRVLDSADADLSTVVLCFEATRRMFGIDTLWAEINARDNQMSTITQHDLYNKLSRFLRKQTYWMARRYAGQSTNLIDMLKPYESHITQFINQGEKALTTMAKARLQVQVETMVSQGAPRALSERIALLATLHHLHDVIDLSHQFNKNLLKTDVLHSLTGEKFGFDLLAKSAAELSSSDPWDRMAARRLIEDVRLEQKTVVRAMMHTMQQNEEPQTIIQTWVKEHAQKLEPLNRLIETFFEAQSLSGNGLSFAKLTILNARLREWVAQFA